MRFRWLRRQEEEISLFVERNYLQLKKMVGGRQSVTKKNLKCVEYEDNVTNKVISLISPSLALLLQIPIGGGGVVF